MKKTAKKLFSLFLAALMLLSCFPLAAAAQGGEVITTTQTAGWEDLPAMELGREFTFTESFRASLVPEKSGLYELYMLNASGGAYDGAKYVAGEDETGSLTKDDVELYYEKSLLELESGKTYNVSCHAIEEDYDAVVKISFVCGHGNKQSKAEVMPSCGLGYTAGVYCPDCKRWLSGHEAVFKSHTDENGDRVCDVCKKESADASGYAGEGENASYKLYSDGELVISGTGAVGSFGIYVGDDKKLSFNDKVKKITIKEGIITLSFAAFYDFESLESVSLPESLEVIDSFVFNSSDLSELYIPSNVKTIEEPDTINSAYFERFVVSPKNKVFSSQDGILFSRDKKVLYAYPGGKTEKSYTVPDGVERIADYAFFCCYDLETLKFPQSLSFVGSYAFSDAVLENAETDGFVKYVDCVAVGVDDSDEEKLPDVLNVREGTRIIAAEAFWGADFDGIILPEGLVSISLCAFEFAAMSNLVIPESVRYIEDGAFNYCGMGSLVVPKSVEYFGDCCFRYMEAIAFLNPSCEIGNLNDEFEFAEGFSSPVKLIVGYGGSTAEKAAKENGSMFAALDEGHEHIYFCTEYVGATCTEDGRTVYSCPCGKSEPRAETVQKGHSWYEESVDSDGTIHYECGVCGETEEEKCGCVCHKGGIYKIFYKLIRVFWKLFRVKRFCDCSIEHY